MLRDFPKMLEFVHESGNLSKKTIQVCLYLLYLLTKTEENKFSISQVKLADALNTDKSTICRSFSELKKLNVIEKVTEEASTFYRFKPITQWINIHHKKDKIENMEN